MRYSVWNGRGYDYYEAAGALADGVFAPNPRMRSYRSIGIAPDEAARPLPSGATLVGKGEFPQGLIATRNAGPLGFLPLDANTLRIAFWVGVGYLVWTRLLTPGQKSGVKKALKAK